MITREQAEVKLQKWFKLSSFYDEQWRAIEKLLVGERVLMIERTGFGKSLVYQFAAMEQEGTTIIFSPLIALMRDQVQKLQSLGIPAAFINSTLEEEEKDSILRNARLGAYKMLYIAPERQEDKAWQKTVSHLQLSMVVVDEAHCISSWGHDFRPSYQRIVNLVKRLNVGFPVLACTATATLRVQEDIRLQLDNSNLTLIRGSLARPNFEQCVVCVDSEEAKMSYVLSLIQQLEGTGVVYCGTQTASETYAKWLEFNGINATFYNAGLDNQTRKSIEEGLMNNSYKCVVSTNALGMGVDKPDIRFVIHTQVPASPLHYYQEIGRAGRDGRDAKVYLLYNEEKDDELPLAFIKGARPATAQYHKMILVLKIQPLGMQAVVKKVNLKAGKVKVILNDLIAQGIVRQNNRQQYEYCFGAPELDTTGFELLRQAKLNDFDQIKGYISTSTCRMNYLRNYLGDEADAVCGACDNDLGVRHLVSASTPELDRVNEFRETYFPLLILETPAGKLTAGVAASYYGVSNIGEAIQRSKEEGTAEFPIFLLKLALKAYGKHYGQKKFDMVLYVPPTISGDLVKNFAHKFARAIKTPISDALIKTRQTQSQKSFASFIGKKENRIDAFKVTEDVKRKRILLIDDVFDSGHTIRSVRELLKKKGAANVTTVVIAKTVGGR